MLLARFLELGSFLGNQFFLRFIEIRCLQQADRDQVFFDDIAELGDDRWHELAARLPITAARVEDSLEFIDEEGDVATFTEYRRYDPRQRHDPLVMIQILRVDKNLEWPPFLVLGALVEHDVVDRHVHRMIRDRGFHLVRGSDQHLGSLQLFMHANDFRTIPSAFAAILGPVRLLVGILRLRHSITDDFLFNLDHDPVQNFP